jgi:putative membrane protein
MMSALGLTAGPAAHRPSSFLDGPMYAMYLWTYVGSVLAHAVFLGLPASAAWGGVAMGTVAIPLALRVRRARGRLPRPAGSGAHVA